MKFLTLLLALHISGCAGAIAAIVKLPFRCILGRVISDSNNKSGSPQVWNTNKGHDVSSLETERRGLK